MTGPEARAYLGMSSFKYLHCHATRNGLEVARLAETVLRDCTTQSISDPQGWFSRTALMRQVDVARQHPPAPQVIDHVRVPLIICAASRFKHDLATAELC